MESEQTIPYDAFNPITSSEDLSRYISTNASENIISACKVNKYFGDKHVLRDVDFEIHQREIVALIDSSGPGKSTLMRCLNGLENIRAMKFTSMGKSSNLASQTNNWHQSVAN